MKTAIMDEGYMGIQAKALKQLRSSHSLTRKDGAFAPLLKQFIKTILTNKMVCHLDLTERSKGNKLKGKGSKNT